MNKKVLTASIMALLLVPAIIFAELQFNFAVGFKGGTYEKFAKSLNDLNGLSYKIKNTKGSSAIISKINRGNSDLGIAQLDIYLNLEERQSGRTDNVKLILPLYAEEIHLFARKNIKSISGLKDKVIAIGDRNSGTAETAMIILLELDMLDGDNSIKSLQFMNIKTGIKKLWKGKIDAMFVVSGAPVKRLAKLPKKISKKVHLLPFAPKELEIMSKSKFNYKKASIKAKHYRWLEKDIETISVISSIIGSTSIWDKEVSNLIKTIFSYKETLERTHPKWKEVNKDTIMQYVNESPQLFHPAALQTLKIDNDNVAQ